MFDDPMILRNGTYIYGSGSPNGGFVARKISDETVMEEMGDEPCYVPEDEGLENEEDKKKEKEKEVNDTTDKNVPKNMEVKEDEEDDDEIQVIKVINSKNAAVTQENKK